MIILRILFFVIGNISGYYVVDNFYEQPRVDGLSNRLDFLEIEAESGRVNRLGDQIKIGYREKEQLNEKNKKTRRANRNERIPDPIIDNILVIYISYAIYGAFFSMLAHKKTLLSENFIKALTIFLNEYLKLTDRQPIAVVIAILSVFVFAFIVKIALSLFSSLVFDVHYFKWNLAESYNLSFYFEDGLWSFIMIPLNLLFLFLGFFIHHAIFEEKKDEEYVNGLLSDQQKKVPLQTPSGDEPNNFITPSGNESNNFIQLNSISVDNNDLKSVPVISNNLND